MPGVGESDSSLAAEQQEQVVLQIEVRAKYAGYIDRQEREIEKHAKQESLRLPQDIDYDSVAGLSNEARQRLEQARPITLGQASRLEGVTPSAVSLILVHLKKQQLAGPKLVGGPSGPKPVGGPSGPKRQGQL